MSIATFLPGTIIDGIASLNIGTLSSTGVNIGRVGFPVNIIGTINVSTVDGPSPVSVGTVLATSVAIGRTGITTTYAGVQNFTAGLRTDLVQASSATQLFVGLDAVGLALSPSSGTISIDQFVVGGALSIGSTLATAITIGRAGITTTNAGTQSFTGNLSADNIISQSGGLMTVGTNANTMSLGPSSGVINIDQQTTGDIINVGATNATSINIGRVGATTTIVGAFTLSSIDVASPISIGTSLATSVTIGHVGITTTINGTADIGTIDRAGAITIGATSATSLALGRAAITTTINGTADIGTIDRAGAITIGGTSATSLTLGRVAFTTTMLGNLDVSQIDRAGIITIGATSATSLILGRSGITTAINGTADIAIIDRAGTITIGGTNATAISIGRTGIATTFSSTTNAFVNGLNTDVIRARTSVTMVIGTNAAGLTLAPTNSAITMDQSTTGAAINIGATNATSILLGHTGITTTIDGTADLANIDRAGTITIGGTSATAIAIGRTGINTTYTGTQIFTNGVNTNLVQARTATTMVVGTGATGLTLASTSGTIAIDQSTTGGAITIGITNATSMSIGRSGITTTYAGTQSFANGLNTDFVIARTATTMNVGTNATGLNLTPASGSITVDQSTTGGAIGVGTTLATSVAVGRSGVTTTVNGTADIANIDRAGSISIGSTSATSIAIGRTGVTTTYTGTQIFTNGLLTNLVQARTATTMVVGTGATGLTLAPASGSITVDQSTTGGAIGVGTTLATSVAIGRVGITTSLNGTVLINGLAPATFVEVSDSAASAGGAVPVTAGYMAIYLRLSGTLVTMTWRVLSVAALVATATGAMTISTVVPVGYRPAGAIVLQAAALISVGFVDQLGSVQVSPASGAIQFNTFTIGQNAHVYHGSVEWSTV